MSENTNMMKKAGITFSEEQGQLLEIAESFSRDKAPIATVRNLIESETGFDKDVWTEMVNLGWLGIAIPEEFGGSGLSVAEVVTIVEPMGRMLLATPLVSTTLAAQLLLDAGTTAQKQDLLPRMAGGAIAALAMHEEHGDWDVSHVTCTGVISGDTVTLSGTKRLVTDAKVADTILATISIAGIPSLVAIDSGSIDSAALQRETVIDETRRSYRINLDGISVPATNIFDAEKTAAALKRYHLLSCLLLSAEACGGTAGAMDITLNYLNTRRTFDRFIGSYQSLKHTMVDILTDLEAARSFLYYAAGVIDTDDGEAAVRMAKAQSSDNFAYAGDRAIQFHGGFGFTYECDAQLFRRRAFWTANQSGDAIYHRKRLATLLLD